MGFYLQIGEKTNPLPLASNIGMADLHGWIDTLDADKYDQIVHLSDWGWCQKLDALESQLDGAMKSDAPHRSDIAISVKSLIDLVKSRPKDAITCFITNGLGPDDGEDDKPVTEEDEDEPPDEMEKTKSTTARPLRVGNRDPMTQLAGPLPQGEAIKAILQGFFARQRDAILEALDVWGDSKAEDGKMPRFSWEGMINGLPAKFTPLDEWAEVLAKEARPVVELLMQQGVDALVAKIGFSPDVFRVFHVVNPYVAEAAQKLTLKFCQETNETTSMQLDDALAKLRNELAEGLDLGDIRVELRKRVNEIFDQADKSRAETIARTEASRATHVGEKIAAEKSGVVKTKTWVASIDACDICLENAAAGDVELDYVYSTSDYGDVTECPAHPRCGCAMAYLLKSKEEIEAFAAGEEEP